MRTREEWLEAAVAVLWPLLPAGGGPGERSSNGRHSGRGESAPAEHGSACPLTKISVGWPKGGSGRGKHRRVGECWAPDVSADGTTHHIFLSPEVTDPVQALAIVGHELCHVWAGVEAKHKGAFIKAARHLGLVKPWTTSTPSEGLLERLQELAKQLGAYPHVGMSLKRKPKQKTRMRLYQCGHGQKIRAATDELQATCDECSTPFDKVEQ